MKRVGSKSMKVIEDSINTALLFNEKSSKNERTPLDWI
jgi:hypothetical protein